MKAQKRNRNTRYYILLMALVVFFSGVLVASYTLDIFRDVLRVNMFDIQGSAMVVNSQGVVIVNQGDRSPYNFFRP